MKPQPLGRQGAADLARLFSYFIPTVVLAVLASVIALGYPAPTANPLTDAAPAAAIAALAGIDLPSAPRKPYVPTNTGRRTAKAWLDTFVPAGATCKPFIIEWRTTEDWEAVGQPPAFVYRAGGLDDAMAVIDEAKKRGWRPMAGARFLPTVSARGAEDLKKLTEITIARREDGTYITVDQISDGAPMSDWIATVKSYERPAPRFGAMYISEVFCK